jgi:hypothetical protein
MDQQVGNSMNQELLSKKFRIWYEELLPDYPVNCWKNHPHFYLTSDQRLSKMTRHRDQKGIYSVANVDKCQLNSADYLVVSDKSMLRIFRYFLNYSIEEYLKYMPLITSSDLIQNPKKICRLITFDRKSWYAAIEVANPQKYLASLRSLKTITENFNHVLSPIIGLTVVPEWVLIGESGKHFFISPFLGYTLEQKFRDTDIQREIKEKVIDTLSLFANYCEQQGVYWRDLAPRNIFLSPRNDQMTLIDFENLFEINSLSDLERICLDRFRRIWFSDMLDSEDINTIFGGLRTPVISRSEIILADSLERAYHGKKEISINDRLNLLELTAEFERKHEFGHNYVYGHRIGLYLSDFVSSKHESKVYFIMENCTKDNWLKFLNLLESCIDIDQGHYLATFYSKKLFPPITPRFIERFYENIKDKKPSEKLLNTS